MKTVYICPVCGGELTEGERTAACPSGHSFDRAKEGYFNLLLSDSSGAHGDNREMIRCRREFLNMGYYDPLCEAVCEEVLAAVPDGGVLIDGGAGECFYTDRMERALTAAGRRADVYAFDISKDAVRFAAKRNPRLRLSVAGIYHAPVATGCADAVVNMFAPLCPEETARMLKPSGRFILVIPEREHLFGLKSVLYDTPYYNTVSDPALPGFTLTGDREIRYDVTLEGQDAIRTLFGMTPYAYRTSVKGKEKLSALSSLSTPLHFRIFTYVCNKK